MPGLAWLTARPIAHRGLHDAAAGVIENTRRRLRRGHRRRLRHRMRSADQRRRRGHGASRRCARPPDRRQRPPRRDERGRAQGGALQGERRPHAARWANCAIWSPAASRCCSSSRAVSTATGGWRSAPPRCCADYAGPVAVMSFDPGHGGGVARDRAAPHARHRRRAALPAGANGRRCRAGALSPWRICCIAARTRPHFVAYAVRDLPAAAPLIARRVFGCRC